MPAIQRQTRITDHSQRKSGRWAKKLKAGVKERSKNGGTLGLKVR